MNHYMCIVTYLVNPLEPRYLTGVDLFLQPRTHPHSFCWHLVLWAKVVTCFFLCVFCFFCNGSNDKEMSRHEKFGCIYRTNWSIVKKNLTVQYDCFQLKCTTFTMCTCTIKLDNRWENKQEIPDTLVQVHFNLLYKGIVKNTNDRNVIIKFQWDRIIRTTLHHTIMSLIMQNAQLVLRKYRVCVRVRERSGSGACALQILFKLSKIIITNLKVVII